MRFMPIMRQIAHISCRKLHNEKQTESPQKKRAERFLPLREIPSFSFGPRKAAFTRLSNEFTIPHIPQYFCGRSTLCTRESAAGAKSRLTERRTTRNIRRYRGKLRCGLVR